MAQVRKWQKAVQYKSKKAALSQGGFLLERGCDVQRHWSIMHELDDTIRSLQRGTF
jgi:hypothetical protein